MQKFNENKNKSEKKENEFTNSPSKQTFSSNKPIPTTNSSQNNFIVKEEPTLPPNLDNREKELQKCKSESTLSSIEGIEKFYRARNTMQKYYQEAREAIKRAEAQQAELYQERVKLQKTMALNDQRQNHVKEIEHSFIDMINYGDVDKIKSWLSEAKKAKQDKCSKGLNVDTVAKAVSIGDKGFLCGVLKSGSVNYNIMTSWGKLPINIAVEMMRPDLVGLLLRNPFNEYKTLSVNPYLGDEFGGDPLSYLEKIKSALLKESSSENKKKRDENKKKWDEIKNEWNEIKKELENATKELDALRQTMKESVNEELERWKTTNRNFEEKIASSKPDIKYKEQAELNEFSKKRLIELKEIVNKTILLPEQKAEILRPLEAVLQKLVLRRSNSVSSYFTPKVELVKPSETPKPETNFGQRLRSHTSKANLGGSQTKRT